MGNGCWVVDAVSACCRYARAGRSRWTGLPAHCRVVALRRHARSSTAPEARNLLTHYRSECCRICEHAAGVRRTYSSSNDVAIRWQQQRATAARLFLYACVGVWKQPGLCVATSRSKNRMYIVSVTKHGTTCVSRPLSLVTGSVLQPHPQPCGACTFSCVSHDSSMYLMSRPCMSHDHGTCVRQHIQFSGTRCVGE